MAHVPLEADAIFHAMRRALVDGTYRRAVAAAPNPYGEGDTGPRVTGILGGIDLNDPRLLNKQTILP